MKVALISTLLLTLAAGGALSAPITEPDPVSLASSDTDLNIDIGNPDCVNFPTPTRAGYSVVLLQAQNLVEQAMFSSHYGSQCYRDYDHKDYDPKDYNTCFSNEDGYLGYIGDSVQVDLKTIYKGALHIYAVCGRRDVNADAENKGKPGYNPMNYWRTGGTVMVKALNGKWEKIFLRSPLPWPH